MMLQDAINASPYGLAHAPMKGTPERDTLIAGPVYVETFGADAETDTYTACEFHIGMSLPARGWPVADVAALAVDPDGWQPVTEDSCLF